MGSSGTAPRDRDRDRDQTRSADGAGAKRAATPAPHGGKRGSGRLQGVEGQSVEHVTIDLDRLIHERMRLGIVSALAVNDVLSFSDLKKLMGTTDGNLSVHARKLEEAGYVECTKGFEGRVPRTEYRLTAAGRIALERYLDHMEALITATRDHV